MYRVVSLSVKHTTILAWGKRRFNMRKEGLELKLNEFYTIIFHPRTTRPNQIH